MLRSRTISSRSSSELTCTPPSEVPTFVGVAVEDGCDRDAVLGEDRRRGDRRAQSARADERDVVLALRAKDLADLGEQRVDGVADAALAELAERREVAPNLRRVDVRVLRDLLRGDAVLAHLLRLRQHLQVPAQTEPRHRPPDVPPPALLHAEFVTTAHILPTCAPEGTVERNRVRLASELLRLAEQRRELVGVDVVPEPLDAVDLDHRDSLAILPLEPVSP